MRELQSILNNYISNTEKQKRHLAILVTLSLLVSFIVPYILVEPADSLTKDSYNLSYYGADVLSSEGNMVSNLNGGQDANIVNGVVYSSGQLSEVTLLIGDGVEWAADCLTADDVIDAAKREYFLGIASDFCVFLLGDFNLATADSEGRVAVGGDIKFSGAYNYQIGNGDYTDGTPLKETDNYKGVTNYAHAIVNGTVTNINTLSQGKLNSDSYYYPLDGDLYKRLVIGGNIDDCKHYSWSTGSAKQVNYSTGCKHDDYTPNEVAQFYQAQLIDFEETFGWLESQSEKLSKKTATGTTSPVENGVITFTGPGTDSDAVTIYFNLPEWDPSINQVRFDDVPETANLIVNCGGNIVKIGPEGSGSTFSTYINGEVISKTDSSGSDVNANNKKESEQILYNFYECGTDTTNLPVTKHGNNDVPYSLFINVNFNGTVMAPYAIVASDEACRGHISGALIAQTFTGGLEFGYRPYRGTTDILGSTAGYVIPFDKLAPNGEHLEGASLVIKDEEGKIVESWKSGTDTQYITLPSEIDLEGGTDYTAEGVQTSVTHTYTIEEQSAPEGYIKTDDYYTIVITETVDVDSLLRTDPGTIPTRILVDLEIYKGEAVEANLIDSRVMTIEDTYSDEGIIQRIVCIEDDGTKQYFVLDINAQDGSINSVGVPTDETLALLQNDIVSEDNGTESNDGAAVVLDDVTLDYQQPDVLEGEETGDGTEGEETGDGTEDEGTGDSTEGEASAFPEGYEAPTLTATYNQTLGDVVFPEVSYGSWTWKDSSLSVGEVGTKPFTAIFTPTDEGYTAQEVELQVTVEPATPTPPDPITVPYGTWLRDISLPSDGNGAWSWQNPDQTGNNLYAFSYQANYTPYNNNYKAISVDVSVTFTKADPPYVLPTGLTAIYGETLADVELPYADNGTWTWQADLTTSVGPAGTSSFIAVFTPNDSNYNTVTPTVQITVNKADPECTFPTNLKATYGQTLADVTGLPTVDNGHFEWEQSSDTVGNAGTNYKNLKFIPNDQNNYNVLTQSVAVEVSKATPTPTVPTNLTVTYGKTLADVTFPTVNDGKWTWAEGVNTSDVITENAGTELTLNVIFNPSDTANFNTVTETVTVKVVKADPTVNPVIAEGSYSQFEALPTINLTTGDTEGIIKWSTSNPSKLKYGENVLTWEFTPEDSTNYETATGTITITAEAIETTPITTITDLKTEDVITLGEGENAVDYYYDPTSMMIMPLPDETPKFINEYGLVFKKLDDNGDLLPGATISLQSGTITNGEWIENTELSIPTWDWTNGTSSSATIPVSEIKVNELELNVVYRFFENEAPSEDYEKADPIYFMKKDASTIIYTQNEDDLADTTKWNTLDLSNGQYTIGMTDRGVYGAGITLVKTDKNGVKLNGAEFELYAVGAKSDVLVYPLNDGEYFEFVNGEVNLYEWFNSVDPNTYNLDYVQNGYLKPGGYYLYEVNPPSQAYERPDGPLYFTVEERTDADGKTYYEVTADKTEVADCVEFTIGTSPGTQIWAYAPETGDAEGATVLEIYSPDASELVLWEGPFAWDQGYGGVTATVVDGVATFTNIPSTIGDFKIQATDNSSFTVTAVKVYSTPPIPNDYTINSMTLSPTPSYYAYTDKVDVTDGVSATISAGSEYANKQITKIEFDITENKNGWGGIQIKPNQSQIAAISPSGGITYTYPEDGSINTSLKFDASGNFYFTWWHYTIDEIRFYVEGAEASTEKPDLAISSMTVHYINGDDVEYTNLTAGDTANEDGSYTFDISSLNMNEVTGMSVTVVDTEDDGVDAKGIIDIGGIWTISGGADTYTFGDTTYKPEVSVEDGDTSHLVNASGTTLTIKNEAQGQETNIIVKKSWVNDTEFTQYRPTEIEVMLYRGTKADGSDKVYIGNITDDAVLANFEGTVKLNESNKWQYTWEDLPSAYAYEKNEDGTENYDKPIRYYYFAEETTVPEGYTVSYPTQGSTSGDYTITNTLKTINLPVKKVWDTKGNTGITIPTEIEVKLQMKVDGQWTDVTGKTLELNADNSWSGTFEDLPEGETYRAFEENVPDGWLYSPDEVGTSEDGTQLTVTNALDVGALTLKKLWSGDTAGNRPGSIKLNIYRTTTRPGSGSTGGGTTGGDYTGDVMTPSSVKDENVTEDYARLLQYSLYFYDAQMCGDEVTEDSVVKWRDDCAVDYSTGKVSGGFHDAGDHIMFGLPQGFTASTLGWSYYEFGNAYDKLGLTTHYKHIMDEFCEFFVDSVKLNSDGSVSSLLVQKGDGSEHDTWGPPEVAVNHTSGETWANSNGSEIAAQYAAALAQYVINFGDPGNYLDTAKALYSYSISKNAVYSCNEYKSNSFIDDQAWAAGWLYLATQNEDYKTFCVNNASINEYWVYSWDEVNLGAACMKAHLTNDWSAVNDYLSNNSNYKCTDTSSYYFVNYWGSARYNAAMQMIALVATKNSDTSYLDWSKYQMAYLLGNNPANTCYVTGFTSNSAKYPHHRSASGYDTSSEKGSYVGYASDGHILVGALVGGPSSAGGSYTDSVQDYNCNEVALDYNVGLVGAAAGLYYLNPSGHTVTEDVMVNDGLELKDGKHTYEYQYQSDASLASVDEEEAVDYSAMSFNLDRVSVKSTEGYGTLLHTIQSPAANQNYEGYSIAGVTKIVVFFDGVTSSGMSLGHNDDWNNCWIQNDGSSNAVVKTLSSPMTIYKIQYNSLNNYSGSSTITKICFYGESNDPTVTITDPTSTTLVVGDKLTLSATSSSNANITWSSNNTNAVTIDSSSGLLTAVDAGNATITANDGSASDTIDITVEALAISGNQSLDTGDKDIQYSYNSKISGATYTWSSGNEAIVKINSETGKAEAVGAGSTDIILTKTWSDGTSTTATLNVTVQKGALSISVNPTRIHVGKTATLSAVNDEGQTVVYSSSDENIATISGNTITAVDAGTVTITGTLGNENPTCTLEILAAPTITAPDNQNLMGTGDKLQLTASNIIGTANWTSLNTDVLTVDPETGLVTAVSNGTAIIKVTDLKDMAFAEYEITVTLIADDPEIPEGLASFKTITLTDADLTAEGIWSRELENLPKTDGNGNKYYYYIAELDSSGNIAESITGTGAIYIPMLYEGNGSALGDDTELSVSNKLSQEIQGQMPSTGGEGSEAYYIYGIILMLCSIAGYSVMKLRRGRRS